MVFCFRGCVFAAGVFLRQAGSVQAMQDQPGRKGDHFLERNALTVDFPLPVDHSEADRKISDDQIAFKAVVFGKPVIFYEEMFPDQIRGAFSSGILPLLERIFLSTGSRAAIN